MSSNIELIERAFENLYRSHATSRRPMPITARQLAYVAAGAVQVEQKLPETPTALHYTQEQARAMERALGDIQELLVVHEDLQALDIIDQLQAEGIIT